MTPNEQRLMNEMIRDAVRDAVVPLRTEIDKLRGADKNHSIRIREVHEQDIPKLRDSFTNERDEHTNAIGHALSKIVHVVNDLSETQSVIIENQRLAEERSKKTLVAVEDGLGGTTQKPASVVAVGQNKALAIDAEAAVAGVRKMTRVQKIALPIVGLVPVAIELWHIVFPHVPK